MFRYPSGWHVHELADGRDGVLISPTAEEPKTWFSAWASELPGIVTAADADALREGVEEGLYRLPRVHLLSSAEQAFGNMLRFERVYSFAENGATRHRKVWMLYVYKWAIALIAQGETPEEYDHWSIMLQDCFDSFDLAPTLWFASDPDNEGKLV
jgi:hypothetical protein